MTDDLVKRLRRTYRKEYAPTRSMCGDNSNKPFPFPILATEVPVNPDGHEAADRIEALQADKAKLRETLKQIEASTYPRPLGKSWRMDLSSSKHDRCIHDEWMYDTCEGCLDDFIRKALQETEQ
jgi:hypothetical protein